jgi:hypothetical protein
MEAGTGEIRSAYRIFVTVSLGKTPTLKSKEDMERQYEDISLGCRLCGWVFHLQKN